MYSLNDRRHSQLSQRSGTKKSRSVLAIVGMVLTGAVLFVQICQPTVSAASQNQRYIVKTGDTLWNIASSLSYGRDTRDVLDQIESLNELDSSAHIYPGQVLQVPSK